MLNLDCESREYLLQLWEKPRIENARQAFSSRQKGYVSAYKAYRNYAINKVCAIDCRESGDIVTALNYERICDNIYNSLPDFAKW